jgi:hypothetical protein
MHPISNYIVYPMADIWEEFIPLRLILNINLIILSKVIQLKFSYGIIVSF